VDPNRKIIARVDQDKDQVLTLAEVGRWLEAQWNQSKEDGQVNPLCPPPLIMESGELNENVPCWHDAVPKEAFAPAFMSFHDVDPHDGQVTRKELVKGLGE
jgi:hypothetical protein